MEKVQMISQQICDTEAIWDKSIEETISKLTTDSNVCVYQTEPIPDSFESNDFETDQESPSLFSDVKRLKALEIGDHDSVRKVRNIRITHKSEPMIVVRSIIGGLSHCYNNLLMGIWGHATLMGMVVDKADPFQTWLEELEDLIQNGSNLIQLLFGYISERRSAARKLRFKQLMKELDEYHRNCGSKNDFSVIEGCASELVHVTSQIQLTTSILPVIHKMQILVSEKRFMIDKEILVSNEKAMTHLRKIDALLQRGNQLVRNLQYYSGAIIPVRIAVCLKTLVQHRVTESTRQYPGTQISMWNSAPAPKVEVDPYQIGYALDQLIDNAARSTNQDGRIRIELNTMSSEAPKDRCGLHMLRNYAVLTISDNGVGMTKRIQSKIFDPFFSGQKGQRSAGLGLSIASGIVRSHGGYIQVRSTPGKGSILQIYLPLMEVS